MRTLSIHEQEEVNGGIAPVVIRAGLFAYKHRKKIAAAGLVAWGVVDELRS